MAIQLDIDKGRQLAGVLYKLFITTGIHGRTDMPEDQPPAGVSRGSLEHVMFLTFSVSIDYQRDANALWDSARKTYADGETRYLFAPEKLAEASHDRVVQDMQKHGLSKKQKKDASIWKTVGTTFHKKWNNDPLSFLESCNWDALEVLDHLKKDTHLNNNRPVPDFPYLRGNKIGPLWLRILRDNAGISKIKNMDKVPIPVDIHVARATLAIGVVRGSYNGSLEALFDQIRQAWFRSTEGLIADNRPMIALDVDEPLWHLSKYGCAERSKLSGDCPKHRTCEVNNFCIKGRIDIRVGSVEIDS